MKKLIGILTLGIAALLAAPSVEARGHRGPSRHYVEFHRSCNGPAWVETYVAYYDSCGHPVYRTRVVPVRRVHRHHHIHGPAYRPAPHHGPAVRPHVHIRPGITVHIGGYR